MVLNPSRNQGINPLLRHHVLDVLSEQTPLAVSRTGHIRPIRVALPQMRG
jgi:hypothetical protein